MRRAALTLLATLCVALLCAAPAAAAFGVSDFDVSFTEADGSAATQAGSHPFQMTTSFELDTVFDPGFGAEVPDGTLKELITDLPVGMAGDPFAAPRCSAADFATIDTSNELPSCPNSTAVGVIAAAAVQTPPKLYSHTPVFNLAPPPGYAAKLGFTVRQVPVTILIGLRETPPYNVYAVIRNTSQVLLVYGGVLRVWGNPADAAHDPYRGNCVNSAVTTETITTPSLGNCPANVQVRPFLTLPSSCHGPLLVRYDARSWEAPGTPVTGFAETHDEAIPPNPQGTTGCGDLGFSAAVDSRLSTTQASSPAGMDFSIEIDDEGLRDPQGTAASTIDEARVTLPEGLTVNPSQAEGLAGCSEVQLAAERPDSAPGEGCPQASKIGSVEVQTPLLEGHVLDGSLFLATPYENPFDSLIALYMVFRDPALGIVVRQAGKVTPDPGTGRLEASFEDIPALPFSELSVHFHEGPRSALVTPSRCGTYATEASFTPSGNPASPYGASAAFAIASGPGGLPCPAGPLPFAPGFAAGTASNAAGSFSPLEMRVTRADGEQDLSRISANLPPGLTAKLAGVARCGEAEIAAAKVHGGREEQIAPSCPAASQIGTLVAGAGAGPALTYVAGRLYLAGPIGGDPFSVVAISPAVAGPFDLGNVVVREGIAVDPLTAEAKINGAVSEPLPRILAGIPLHLRDLRISVDRPGFALNATNCEEMAVRAAISGESSLAVPESRYQAADCAALGFAPKLSLRLKGGTKRSANPALRAVLTGRPGDANLKGAEVILPPSQFIDNSHINNPCTRVQFDAGACPAGSVLGRARALTPLLDAPLEGPVYFRSNGGERQLPDVVADLGGELHFTVVIAILHSKGGRVRTKVLNAPDAPVSKFVLRMAGGRRGLLENSTNLCRRPQRAAIVLTAQSGRRRASKPVVGTNCKNKNPKHRRKSRVR